MEETWTCGDCHTAYPMSVHYCTRYLDDYLALRGGSVESAIHGAVERAVEPLVAAALLRLRHNGGIMLSIPPIDPEARSWSTTDGDQRCQECGSRNPVWGAFNDDWNAIMPNDGVLCPSCYHVKWLVFISEMGDDS